MALEDAREVSLAVQVNGQLYESTDSPDEAWAWLRRFIERRFPQGYQTGVSTVELRWVVRRDGD